MKTKDQLLDLYGISKAEARHYWQATLYVDVLRDKIAKANKLMSKLIDVDMLIRDSQRIKRIDDSITFNLVLLDEVSASFEKETI